MKLITKLLLSAIFSYVSIFNNLAFSQQTLWEQMPKSQEGKFNFFKQNDSRGVFKSYGNMRGTRLIFACVNAQVFSLYAYQKDWVKDVEEAQEEASKKCSETIEMSFDKSRPPIRLPIGSPILLRFEKDYSAYEGYQNSLSKWSSVAGNDQSQLFTYNGKVVVTPAGYKSVWVLSNFNKEMQFASLVSLREFDCSQRKFRISKYITYSEKYGYGNKVQELNGNLEWTLAPPGSLYEALVDSVCK